MCSSPATVLALLAAFSGRGALALDDGLAATPPMGWRSWNLFGGDVNQSLIMGIMDGMVSRKRTVDGVPTSLCDLGYCDVGLDDNWQDCQPAGKGGYSYHDADGNPLINHDRFPDLAAMTAHAHKLGLTAGWYGNNCICMETERATRAMYERDVHYLTEVFKFDGVKLDGCGTELNLELFSDLITASGRPVVIENCHWGVDTPSATWCPFHFYRVSLDINVRFSSMLSNLNKTVPFAKQGLSRPGCWAYPDMLEVGCKRGTEMNPAETRTHFGAWCIVSSPLILSHNVLDDAVMDRVWPVIANKEALAVNQAWAGHSGSPFKESGNLVPVEEVSENGVLKTVLLPSYQFFYKPLDQERVAVLLVNLMNSTQTLELDVSEVPGLKCSSCHARDIWAHADFSAAVSKISKEVESHDCLFLILSGPAAAPAESELVV